MKPKKCKGCGSPFQPVRPLQVACSPMCGLQVGRAKQEKAKEQAKKAERAQDKARLRAIEPLGKLIKEAQVVVNRYVRVKALANGESCYTCGASPEQKFGGTYDASHFRSVGSAPHLRFWLPQIRLACITCNRYKSGNLLEFRKALVAEHGLEWVEALEARQEVARFRRDYLIRLKAVINKRLRRLQKRSGVI